MIKIADTSHKAVSTLHFFLHLSWYFIEIWWVFWLVFYSPADFFWNNLYIGKVLTYVNYWHTKEWVSGSELPWIAELYCLSYEITPTGLFKKILVVGGGESNWTQSFPLDSQKLSCAHRLRSVGLVVGVNASVNGRVNVRVKKSLTFLDLCVECVAVCGNHLTC